jgi:hypothetical protein
MQPGHEQDRDGFLKRCDAWFNVDADIGSGNKTWKFDRAPNDVALVTGYRRRRDLAVFAPSTADEPDPQPAYQNVAVRRGFMLVRRDVLGQKDITAARRSVSQSCGAELRDQCWEWDFSQAARTGEFSALEPDGVKRLDRRLSDARMISVDFLKGGAGAWISTFVMRVSRSVMSA